MKKISKIMPLLLVIPFLGGCSTYHSDASEKTDLVGTYRLKTITKNRNKNEDPYDYKSEIGAEAYFTLDIDGYVYYAYKDNNTSWNVKQAYAIYSKDDEDENLYKAIQITDGISGKSIWEKEVGCMDEPTMGFQNSAKKSWVFGKKDVKQGFQYTIHYSEPKWTNSNHGVEYQYVYYEKISSECSLEYLNGILGSTYKFNKPFELKNCKGFYAYSAQVKIDDFNRQETRTNGVFEYAIIDFESYHDKKLDLYYSLVSDPGLKKGTVDVRFDENENINSLRTIVLTVFEKEYYCYSSVSNLGSYFNDSVIFNEEDKYTSQCFGMVGEPGQTIEQVLNDLGLVK